MKNKLKTSLLIAAIVGVSSSLTASQMQVLTPEASTGYEGLTADGTSLTTFAAGTWVFEIGTFGGDPAAMDPSTWDADFAAVASTEWIVSPPFLAGKIDESFLMDDASFTGSQGYVWGFNSKTIDAGTEWVLVTNAAWEFPQVEELSTEPASGDIWNLADAGNTYIAGDQLANGFQTEAIPEPSTYALIFGVGILGFLGFRRFRK